MDVLPTAKQEKIKLIEINEYLTCPLCKGYYIDATTISECLHSFCRSCIIEFLQDNSHCPICEVIINKAKPNIKLDKTLQDIVYKLVPELFLKEMARRQNFYGQHPDLAVKATSEERGEDTERTIFNPKDLISLSIEYISDDSTPGAINVPASFDTNKNSICDSNDSQIKRFLQCPGMCRIEVLKKFVQNKYNVNTVLFHIEILYKRVPLPNHYTLIDIAYIYSWKRNEPMKFFFRIMEKSAGGKPDESENVSMPEIFVKPIKSLRNSEKPKSPRGQNRKKSSPTKKIVEERNDVILNADKIKNEIKSKLQDIAKGPVYTNITLNRSNNVEIITKVQKVSNKNGQPIGLNIIKQTVKKANRSQEKASPKRNAIKNGKNSDKQNNGDKNGVEDKALLESEEKKSKVENDLENKLKNASPLRCSGNWEDVVESEQKNGDDASEIEKEENREKNDSEMNSVIRDKKNDEGRIKLESNKENQKNEKIESENLRSESPKNENLKIKSENVKSKAEIAKVDSPKLKTNSPKLKTNSPKLKTNSPKLKTNSPKKKSNSPKWKIDSSKSKIAKSKSKIDSLKSKIASPKSKTDSPKPIIESPKLATCKTKIANSKIGNSSSESPRINPENPKNENETHTNSNPSSSTHQESKDDNNVIFQALVQKKHFNIDDEKSNFLKSIELTARSALQTLRSLKVPEMPPNPPPNPTQNVPKTTQKRKNSSPVRNDRKKPKKSEPSVEKIVKLAEKQKNTNNTGDLQSLFSNCKINIPSSLSITLKESSEDDRDRRNAASLKPVQNYIEILKLPDTTMQENLKMELDNRFKSKSAPNLPCKSTNMDGMHTFQKMFEESIKKSEAGDNVTTKRNLMEIATQLHKKTKVEFEKPPAIPPNLPKVPIPRLNSQKNQMNLQMKFEQTYANLHSSSLGMNYTVSVAQSSGKIPSKIEAKVENSIKSENEPQNLIKKDEKVIILDDRKVNGKIILQSNILLKNKGPSIPPRTNLMSSTQPPNALNVNLTSRSNTSPNISPRLGNNSPRPGNNSPRPGNNSPRPGNNSPRPGNNSPRRRNNSPRPGNNSPRLHISPRSNDISPRSNDISPRSNDISSRSNDFSPRSNDISSRSNDILSRSNDILSRSNDISPRLSGNSPRPSNISPRSNMSPIPNIPSPKPKMSPEKTPNSNTNAQQQVIEKYNIQNLAQLTASLNFNSTVFGMNHNTQLAALQQAMLLKQFELHNRQNWQLNQYEKYLQNRLLSKEN